MRCRACDYELWHCTGRICPECGEPFTLRDYEFEPETVLFHCPHCNHSTEGRGSMGWPDLTIEQCTSCGLATGLDYYIVRPVAGHENSMHGSLLPIRTGEGNWFSRYFQTLWLVMTKPGRTIGRIPIHESLAHAWGFYLTTVVITFAVGLIPALLLVALPVFSTNTMQGAIGLAGIGIFLVLYFVVGFVAICIYVLVWAVMTHVILKMTGGCTFTIRRTMQGILYAGGSSIVNIVPCVGGIAGSIWWVVSAINMVSRGQRVSGGRATVAVLGAPVVLVLCVCGGYGILVASIVSPAITRARSIAQQQMQQAGSQVDLEEVIVEESTEDQQSE